MLRSLYSGVSAIKVNQAKLDVIANNIANVGTTAFKSSRVRFKDMISQSVTESAAPGTNQGGVNLKQVGQGVQISGIDTMVGQGMMQPTSRTLDVAMDGEGYLMVAKGAIPGDNAGGVSLDAGSKISNSNGMEMFYTRDGALTLDNAGNLLNSDGLRVLGYTFDNIAYANGVPTLSYVDANDTVTPDDNLVPLVIPETITVPEITIPASVAYVAATGTVGQPGYVAAVGTPPSADYVAATGTVGQPGYVAAIGTPPSVAYAAGPPVVGTPASTIPAHAVRITSYSIEKDGQIKAVLADGKVSVLGQVAMSSFKNPAGLAKVGGNLYGSTSNSGDAVVRTSQGSTLTDNTDGFGDMLSGMLEMSNVDLAESFTDMIITTRAFQAAGKTITTGDEILQEIINLKR